MKITLEFDDEASARRFMGWWLDGGGETYCDFNTTDWTKDYLRVKNLEVDYD